MCIQNPKILPLSLFRAAKHWPVPCHRKVFGTFYTRMQNIWEKCSQSWQADRSKYQHVVSFSVWVEVFLKKPAPRSECTCQQQLCNTRFTKITCRLLHFLHQSKCFLRLTTWLQQSTENKQDWNEPQAKVTPSILGTHQHHRSMRIQKLVYYAKRNEAIWISTLDMKQSATIGIMVNLHTASGRVSRLRQSSN